VRGRSAIGTASAATTLLFLAAALMPAPAAAQQPREDPREIAPTPGVTPIDTPASARTSVTPARRRTPPTTRTPSASGASTADSAGDTRRGSAEPPDTRDALSWSISSLLLVALGWVTIRMRRHRFDPRSMLELLNVDLRRTS
jgi:hypothetical protein